MAKQAKQATEQAVAPVAGNAPTHTAVAYRGEKVDVYSLASEGLRNQA